MNGVRVLTAQSVACGDRVRFLVTGTCQSMQANFPYSICNRRSVRLLFLRHGKQVCVDYTALRI